MFAPASDDRPADQNEIWRYWVFAPDELDGDAARIERFIPASALSRDRAQADALRHSVALYRVAFGQPRPDDLLAYLSGQIDEDEFERLVGELRIDLCTTMTTEWASDTTGSIWSLTTGGTWS